MSDLVTATLRQFDQAYFYQKMLSDALSEQLMYKIFYPDGKFSTHYCGDDPFFLHFNSSWAGQPSIVDFSAVTPYIPDSPSKENKHCLTLCVCCFVRGEIPFCFSLPLYLAPK